MKKSVLIIMMMVFVLGLAGCGGKTSDTSGDAADTSGGASDNEVSVNRDSLAGKARFVYNGVEFGTGDKASEVTAKLDGSEIKPSEKSQPCVPGASEIETFYYPGFTFDVSKDDVILMVCLTNDYDESRDCKTVGGVGLGDSLDDAKNILGTENCTETEFGLNYQEDDLFLTINIGDDGSVFSIRAEDTSIEF